MKQKRGERDHYAGVWFTEDEWSRVEARRELTGAKNFGDLARRAILDGDLKVNQGNFDPRQVRAELARIGNNLNQIARLANTENHLTLGQAMEARRIMQEVQKVITQAVAQGRGGR